MKRNDQRRIVREMLKELRRTMEASLPFVPEDWDGRELRQLLADAAAEFVIKGTMDPRRTREYRNACMVDNLPRHP